MCQPRITAAKYFSTQNHRVFPKIIFAVLLIKFWYIGGMAIIDPRHLVQFHEIIRTGSFTRAAETLGLTQPALTRNMKVMEGRLGFEV